MIRRLPTAPLLALVAALLTTAAPGRTLGEGLLERDPAALIAVLGDARRVRPQVGRELLGPLHDRDHVVVVRVEVEILETRRVRFAVEVDVHEVGIAAVAVHQRERRAPGQLGSWRAR